jgi:hypothetical protein
MLEFGTAPQTQHRAKKQKIPLNAGLCFSKWALLESNQPPSAPIAIGGVRRKKFQLQFFQIIQDIFSGFQYTWNFSFV